MADKSHGNDRGSVLVLVVIVLVVLIGVAALAIDVGQMCIAKQKVQNQCDAAVMAGVWELALNHDRPGTAQMLAQQSVDQCVDANNALNPSWQVLDSESGSPGLSVTFVEGFVTDDAGRSIPVNSGEAVSVSGRINTEFSFARIFGLRNTMVAATATAIMQIGKGFRSYDWMPLSVSNRTIFGDGTPDHLPIEFGERTELKVSSFDNGYLGPGNCGCLVLPGDKPGASVLNSRIRGDESLRPLDMPDPPVMADTEPGNISSIRNALSDRLRKETDPLYISPARDSTAWDSWVSSSSGSQTMLNDPSWRIVLVPIVRDPEGPVQGRKEVEIIGMAGFFIEEVSGTGKDCVIQGRFIQGVSIGDDIRWIFPGTGTSPTSPLMMRSIRLIS